MLTRNWSTYAAVYSNFLVLVPFGSDPLNNVLASFVEFWVDLLIQFCGNVLFVFIKKYMLICLVTEGC